jgi:long-chain acyl-CoA synthetase
VDVQIVAPDETGTGEIVIRGPMVMEGYYRNQAATAEALKDGWFHSGDLGRVDAKGNVFVTGRKKEVIVLPNGKNIYPDELEAHYSRSPYIQEIAVIGVSDAQERGERLHAIVVPNFDYLKSRKIANAREALRDEIAGLSNQLPKYKRLMSYQIQSDPLLRTTTRKIKRLELKNLVESGQLSSSEITSPPTTASRQDADLMLSAVGQEVLNCIRNTYHRNVQIEPNMNLELDLGFDSMERVELLASLEQILNLQLPDDFGAEILTIRDLIAKLERQAGVVTPGGTQDRQSWNKILAEDSLAKEAAPFKPSGLPMSLLKYLTARLIYVILFKTFLRLEVRGLKQLPGKGPYLVCPNHQSYLDAFVLIAVLPFRVFRNMFFVGYSAMFTSRLMKLVARLTNIVPVDPDAHLLRAMKAGAYGLRSGRILCIFPEGGRSFDDTLQEFKKGAAILSRELSVPMVPTAIQGTHYVWPRDSMRIRPHKVKITFGQPLQPSTDEVADLYQEDTLRLKEAILKLLK